MLELAALSVVLLILAVVGIVWDIASGLLVTGVDGILLLLVCLMMGGVFTLELYLVGRQTGWVPALGGGKKKDAPQASPARAVSAKSAAPAATPAAATPPIAAKPAVASKPAAPTSEVATAKVPSAPGSVSAGIPEPIPPAPASSATSAAIAAQPPAPAPPDGRAAAPTVSPSATEQPKTDQSR